MPELVSPPTEATFRPPGQLSQEWILAFLLAAEIVARRVLAARERMQRALSQRVLVIEDEPMMAMNIAHILQRHAATWPHVPAIIDTHWRRSRRTTFAELDRLAARAAGLLWRHGLRPGDAVLVFHPMSAELYAALMAIFRLRLIAMACRTTARSVWFVLDIDIQVVGAGRLSRAPLDSRRSKMAHRAYKVQAEVQAGGRIEVTVPLEPGSRVEVVILAPEVDEFTYLVEASASSMGFWDNTEDDSEWDRSSMPVA